MKVKISHALSSFLLLLIVSSVEVSRVSIAHGAHAVRIPEHACSKRIGWSKCDWQKCIRKCFKESSGVGKCRDAICVCTYYCKQPPQ